MIEIKVHHFSAVQTGSIISLPSPMPDTTSSTPDDTAAGGNASGGCFIKTVDYGPLFEEHGAVNATFAIVSLLLAFVAGGFIIVQRLAKQDKLKIEYLMDAPLKV